MEIKYLASFDESFAVLDKSEAILVKRTVDKLDRAHLPLGKPLKGSLKGFFGIRTGQKARLRLVYLPSGTEFVLLRVGPREDSRVYSDAQNLIEKLGLNS